MYRASGFGFFTNILRTELYLPLPRMTPTHPSIDGRMGNQHQHHTEDVSSWKLSLVHLYVSPMYTRTLLNVMLNTAVLFHVIKFFFVFWDSCLCTILLVWHAIFFYLQTPAHAAKGCLITRESRKKMPKHNQDKLILCKRHMAQNMSKRGGAVFSMQTAGCVHFEIPKHSASLNRHNSGMLFTVYAQE